MNVECICNLPPMPILFIRGDDFHVLLNRSCGTEFTGESGDPAATFAIGSYQSFQQLFSAGLWMKLDRGPPLLGDTLFPHRVAGARVSELIHHWAEYCSTLGLLGPAEFFILLLPQNNVVDSGHSSCQQQQNLLCADHSQYGQLQ